MLSSWSKLAVAYVYLGRERWRWSKSVAGYLSSCSFAGLRKHLVMFSSVCRYLLRNKNLYRVSQGKKRMMEFLSGAVGGPAGNQSMAGQGLGFQKAWCLGVSSASPVRLLTYVTLSACRNIGQHATSFRRGFPTEKPGFYAESIIERQLAS